MSFCPCQKCLIPLSFHEDFYVASVETKMTNQIWIENTEMTGRIDLKNRKRNITYLL